MTGITADNAFSQLSGITTKEAFQALLNSISVYAEGSSTVLYSGPLGEGLSTSQIAEEKGSGHEEKGSGHEEKGQDISISKLRLLVTKSYKWII